MNCYISGKGFKSKQRLL